MSEPVGGAPGHQLPAASLPPVEKTGFLLGRTIRQWVLAAGVEAPLLVAGFSGGNLGRAVLLVVTIGLPWGLFTLGSWRGRSFVLRASTMGVFMARRWLGQTHTVGPIGGTADREGQIDLPGAFGQRVTTVEMWRPSGDGSQKWAGSFLWDAAEGTATVVIRARTADWETASHADRLALVGGFQHLCREIARIPAIKQVGCHMRTLPKASQDLVDDYLASQGVTGARDLDSASVWGPPGSELVQDEGDQTPGAPAGGHRATSVTAARDLAGVLAGLDDLVEHDVLLTITFNPNRSPDIPARDRRRLGGVSDLVGDTMAQVVPLLGDAGLKRGARWLDAASLAAEVRRTLDPGAATWLDRLGGRLPDTSPCYSYITEQPSYLEADGWLHRIYWMESVASTGQEAGFLEALISQLPFLHTVTLLFEPIPWEQADKKWRAATQAAEQSARVRDWAGRPAGASVRAEAAELAGRAEELMAGFGDTRFTGFVTVSAPDLAQLDAREAHLRRAGSGVTLTLQRFSQWPLFLAAALPLGIGVRRP